MHTNFAPFTAVVYPYLFFWRRLSTTNIFYFEQELESALRTHDGKLWSVKIWLGGEGTYIVKDHGVYLMRMATLLLNR